MRASCRFLCSAGGSCIHTCSDAGQDRHQGPGPSRVSLAATRAWAVNVLSGDCTIFSHLTTLQWRPVSRSDWGWICAPVGTSYRRMRLCTPVIDDRDWSRTTGRLWEPRLSACSFVDVYNSSWRTHFSRGQWRASIWKHASAELEGLGKNMDMVAGSASAVQGSFLHSQLQRPEWAASVVLVHKQVEERSRETLR